ncbi:hypothetical protein AK812_SmicGene13784 [Symbiodinium microadriaticum]|uniref:Reverse transcriptase domain-containing protein n=1 Tax=Symbiodinium microadriaticum TaxID=2951 RepID=A0A1Q9E7B1_SYMMI|nr:hypothetical protein AK812_SmicGene13784 [Symbiodinium microadriaticum]CAE7248993.1 unnamed protein product [Symbiodinium sp. KB8]
MPVDQELAVKQEKQAVSLVQTGAETKQLVNRVLALEEQLSQLKAQPQQKTSGDAPRRPASIVGGWDPNQDVGPGWINLRELARQLGSEEGEVNRQGSPDSPSLFSAGIGEAIDQVIQDMQGKEIRGDHPRLPPAPFGIGAFMDDTYVWGANHAWVQDCLAAVVRRFAERGLEINPKKTMVTCSTEAGDAFRTGEHTVASRGPDAIMTVLGSPVTFVNAPAAIIAEMQHRARRNKACGGRWSSFILRVRWWREEQQQLPDRVRAKHPHQFNTQLDDERKVAKVAGDHWQDAAQHRERWAGMTDDFILKFDVEWASGKQAQLGNIQQSRPGPAKGDADVPPGLPASHRETFSCPAPQPTSSNQVSTLSASIAAMRMTAPCLAAALGVGLAWAAMRMGDPAAVPFQTSRESADWLTEEPRTNSTEPSPGTAGLTTDASTFIRRVNASNISLGWKPDGNPAKLWLTLSQPPERRRRAAVAGKVKRLIIEAGGPSLIARIELEWGGPHFLDNDAWMLVHGKQQSEWRGCGVAFLKTLEVHLNSHLKLAACTIFLKLHDAKTIGLISGHVSHKFIIAETAAALQQWGESPACLQPKVVLGFDANETFLQPGDLLEDETLSCTGRGEQILTWCMEQGITLPPQHCDKPSHFPYNPDLTPRRIDYVASRNLRFAFADVGAYRDRARSDHEPILAEIVLPTPQGPKSKVIWSARQLKLECHAVLSSAVPVHANHHHAIAHVSRLITEPVHRSMKFQESCELKKLRKVAKGVPPGPESRKVWKLVEKTLKQERKAWQRDLAGRAGALEWNAYRAVKQKSSRSNWAEHLLESPDWEDALKKHMSTIFAQKPPADTAAAMQGMRDEASRLCKTCPWRPFSESEMRITMAKWKQHKATGTDGIALEALQLLFEDSYWRPRIAELINDSLYPGDIPEWVSEGASVLLPKTAVPQGWSDTRWQHLCKAFIVAFDPPWASGNQLALRSSMCFVLLMVSVLCCLRSWAGPSPTPAIIIVDSDSESDTSDMPWAPLEPEPSCQPTVVEADEVTDMPIEHHEEEEQLGDNQIGYAQTYDPAADPWHEDGMFPGAGQFHPPTMDPWGFIARPKKGKWNQKPLWKKETPLQHDADDELTDVPEDDLEWDSDQPDTEDEEEEPEPASASAAASGAKAPKGAAGHGSQRVANKAKKSDVKKVWREMNWGKKPKWLSWRAALAYIQRGEQPPAKEPLPPTPSPQREHLQAALAAHHYSYDAQGNLIPHHPRPPQSQATHRGDKASNQAREVQLRGDGVANCAVQIIDTGPIPAQDQAGGQPLDTADQQLHNHFHKVIGDLLVV